MVLTSCRTQPAFQETRRYSNRVRLSTYGLRTRIVFTQAKGPIGPGESHAPSPTGPAKLRHIGRISPRVLFHEVRHRLTPAKLRAHIHVTKATPEYRTIGSLQMSYVATRRPPKLPARARRHETCSRFCPQGNGASGDVHQNQRMPQTSWGQVVSRREGNVHVEPPVASPFHTCVYARLFAGSTVQAGGRKG
jgi:hypothetical protein